MQQYRDMLQHIMKNWVDKEDRTWVGTRSVFGYQMRFDLSKWFPLVTTKKTFMKAIIHELLWFLSWDTNIRYLVQNNVKIWNEWAYSKYLQAENLESKYPRYSEEWQNHMIEFVEKIKDNEDFAKKWGDLWPIYGKQWVAWETKDGKTLNQIEELINLIKTDPTSRRLIISWWNAWEVINLAKDHHWAPPPCHTLFQFMVINNKLSCQLYQRSADTFLWVPFNIASYSLLTMMIAQVCNLELWDFVHTFWDAHIYSNHFEQVQEQLSRTPYPLPTMKINPTKKDIFSFSYEDFTLENYVSHPSIKAPIAV